MEHIRLKKIDKCNNTIEYEFEYSQGLSRYFTEDSFLIEYPCSIENVPNSIAAIPFVCNVLPVMWITNAILEVEELDEAFYNSIPEFKKGYIAMFPETSFLGELKVNRIIECDIPSEGKAAAFFSGGLDAVNTLVRHIDEKPALISIWGSDIRYDNIEGWNIMHNEIIKTAEKFKLPDVVIRSTFRNFDREDRLTEDFGHQLKDNWWHGLKHSIGLLGHSAPYTYLHKISKIYFASTNCLEDEPVKCASHPSIDNNIRYGDAIVVHDGYEFSRQDKARNVVDYACNTGNIIPLKVCWESQQGGNCCHCEKCYRTMSNIIAEGADPVQYGFIEAESTMHNMQRYLLVEEKHFHEYSTVYWVHIKKAIMENKNKLKANSKYWNDIKWMLRADFRHPETLQMPSKSLREWLSKRKFYQKLHDIKTALRK